jgi:hypothetical protein
MVGMPASAGRLADTVQVKIKQAAVEQDEHIGPVQADLQVVFLEDDALAATAARQIVVPKAVKAERGVPGNGRSKQLSTAKAKSS